MDTGAGVGSLDDLAVAKSSDARKKSKGDDAQSIVVTAEDWGCFHPFIWMLPSLWRVEIRVTFVPIGGCACIRGKDVAKLRRSVGFDDDLDSYAFDVARLTSRYKNKERHAMCSGVYRGSLGTLRFQNSGARCRCALGDALCL